MQNSIDQDKSELFRILKAQAFSRGKFVLSSGKTSDYYLDARRVTLSCRGGVFNRAYYTGYDQHKIK